jgi:hypothetical protein
LTGYKENIWRRHLAHRDGKATPISAFADHVRDELDDEPKRELREIATSQDMLGTLRVSTLRQCWTRLIVVRGDRCFHVCGYSADDLLGLPNPQILDRKGKVFLARGNEVRRLEVSELRAWLFEDELRATERTLGSSAKICVVRTDTATLRRGHAWLTYQALRFQCATQSSSLAKGQRAHSYGVQEEFS